jgi:hypothetical protein
MLYRKLPQKWLEDRLDLLAIAKYQLTLPKDQLIKERLGIVPNRSIEVNEYYAKMLCNNVINNITQYLNLYSNKK